MKRKIEQHGEVLVTDRGEPAYLLRSFPRETPTQARLPDYYGKLVKRQPKAFTAEETRAFWEEERR